MEKDEKLPEDIAQLRRELKYWRFMAIGAVVAMLLIGLLTVTGCEAPDSMYIRSTNTTPVHIFVDNTDDFPVGGGGGDMLKSVYDPDEDGIFVRSRRCTLGPPPASGPRDGNRRCYCAGHSSLPRA